MNCIKKINEEFQNIPDLIHRKIRYSLSTIHIFYMETVASGDRVNDYILKNITNPIRIKTIKNILAAPNFKVIEDINKDKKLDLVVNEILRINKEYQLEIQDIDRRYNENNELIEDNSKELEIEKKDKKE